MQRFRTFAYKYRNYIRVFVYSFIVFTAIDLMTFSRKKDPELLKYFNKNLNLIKTYCTDAQFYYPYMTSVTFEKIKLPGVVGYCNIKANGFRLVFDKPYWDNLSELTKTQLMLHEMAHCMFDQEHVDDPNNFMYPEMNHIDGLSLAIQVHQYLSFKCGNNPNG